MRSVSATTVPNNVQTSSSSNGGNGGNVGCERELATSASSCKRSAEAFANPESPSSPVPVALIYTASGKGTALSSRSSRRASSSASASASGGATVLGFPQPAISQPPTVAGASCSSASSSCAYPSGVHLSQHGLPPQQHHHQHQHTRGGSPMEVFNLRWDEYHRIVIDSFWSLFTEESLVDCTLVSKLNPSKTLLI